MSNFNIRAYLKFLPFYLLSVIPFRGLYLISDLMYFLLYYVFGYRRKVVRMNLTNSFPGKCATEINAIEKEFYQHFCDIAFESIKVLTISKDAVARRYRIKNIELIEKLYQEEKSIILYTAHYGNWEWLGFLPLFMPYQAVSFYQKLSSGYYDHFMQMTRSRFGVRCIESKQGYKNMVKFQEEHLLTMTYMVGDQSPTKSASKHWVRFLNQDTAFLMGTDRIARKLNQVVLFPSYRKLKRGVYEVEFIPIELNPSRTNSQDIIDKYAHALENSINQSPALWLWSHRRWKLSRQDTP
jgi:KDO2-lipid IV(A) lauroyltransferase